MSSWDFNYRQNVSFNKLPKDENTDTCFGLDHDNNAVNQLASALSSSKLSDDYYSDLSDQPHTLMLKDKTNKLVDNKFNEGERILANLCASQEEWNSKAKVTIDSTRPSRNCRPIVKLIKTRAYCQNSPVRSPLAKQTCLTGNFKHSLSDQQHLSTRSQSTVAVSNSTEAQKCLPDSDSLLKTTERKPLESTMGPLDLNGKGRILCIERSHSLSSVTKDSQYCLQSRSVDLNPLSKSATDLDRNLKLACASESKPSDAKLAKEKKFPHKDKGNRRTVTGVSTLKSSEQLELEKMEELRKDLENKRKIAQESMVKALAVLNQPGIHSTRETTKPVPFHFATDNRFNEPLSRPVHRQKDFAMLLRVPEPTLQKTQPRGPTVVQPFNLTADKKRKREDETAAKPVGYKFQTMAEKVLQFCTKTPERFRRKHTDPPSPRASDMALRITVAETPNLRTKTRQRKVDAVSREEREENEVQEMKKLQFKALPLNKRILSQQDRLKSVPVKPQTVIEPFKLTATLQRTEENEETRFEFHAQPVPKAVFEPEAFSKKDTFKCTIPQSPAFSWKKNPVQTYRASASDLSQLVKEETRIKAPPVPKFDEPFQPVLHHRHTEPHPFSFEERIKDSVAKKEKTIQMVLEDEARTREFVANPIPDLSPVLPKKKVIRVTEPVPFVLATDERGAEKARKFEEKVEEEERKFREAANFRAQPVAVIYEDPFVPQKVTHPQIEPEPFKLQTEERAAQRKEWEMWKKAKEEEEERECQEMERKRLEEEAAEVQQLRREAVHRANPIRHYKPLEARDMLPLTEPQSPNFSERLKPQK